MKFIIFAPLTNKFEIVQKKFVDLYVSKCCGQKVEAGGQALCGGEKLLKVIKKNRFLQFNPLMPNRYNCTYVLLLFLRSRCCKKLILSMLTHKSPKHTMMGIEINHTHYKLNH